MESSQILTLKTDYLKEATRPDKRKSTLAEYVRIISDCNIECTTSKDMVIFDDANSMVHGICINDDMRGQADFPAKIISIDYSHVAAVECVMSLENFEKFLDEGFLNVSDERKEFILNWFKLHPIRGQAIYRATPYYSEDVKVTPSHVVAASRDDGIKFPSAPATLTYPKPSEEEEDPEGSSAGKSGTTT